MHKEQKILCFKILLVAFVLSNAIISNAQSNLNNDTTALENLENKSYLDLEKVFWSDLDKFDTVKKLKYAKAYLRKAKKEKDTLEIADAYFMMTYCSKLNTLSYLDSIIGVTKNKTFKNQPINAYILKASIFGQKNDYKRALLNLEKANFYAKKQGSVLQLNDIKYFISRFKTNLGDYESAKKLQKELVLYYKNSNDFYSKRAYIVVSEGYANSLNFLNKPDSALLIVKNLIPLSLKTKDSVIYNKLLISSAISNYQTGNYKISLDSIYKLKEYNRRKVFSTDVEILINLYEGKNYLEQQKKKRAIQCFKKVDSISGAKNYYHSYVRENYTLMYNYYKNNNDINNQLHYIDKLLVTDSILNNDFKYLAKNVNDKFTKPNLIDSKQKIIKSLEKEKTKRISLMFALLFLIILIIVITLRNIKRKKLYKKHIANLETPKKVKSYLIDDKTTLRILNDLSKIEETDFLLSKDFSLVLLAKELETNTSYLSKIINEHKKKTFKQYLIDYRIRFLIQQLDTKLIMRKYSIEALAESVGYTNASSFTRIFKNYTGKSPSEFLKSRYSTDDSLF